MGLSVKEIEREEVTLVIPDGVTEISVSAVKLCEMFASALLASSLPVIDIAVDSKNDAVTSNDSRVKEAVTLIMKTRQLAKFYDQLAKLLIVEPATGARTLKLVAKDLERAMTIQQQRGLPDLHLRIQREP